MIFTRVVNLDAVEWACELHRIDGGIVVVFHNTVDGSDQMRSWLSAYEGDEHLLVEAARDPVCRFWTDGFGRRWRITLEWKEEGCSALFSSGAAKVQVPVPPETHLGELSENDLKRLLAFHEIWSLASPS